MKENPYPFMNYPAPQLRLTVQFAAKEAMWSLLDALKIDRTKNSEASAALSAVLGEVMHEHDREATGGDTELMVAQVNHAMNAHDEIFSVIGAMAMLADQLTELLPEDSDARALADAIEQVLSHTFARVWGQDSSPEEVRRVILRYKAAPMLERALCAIDETPPWEGEKTIAAIRRIARDALSLLAPPIPLPGHGPAPRAAVSITTANGIHVGMPVKWPHAFDPLIGYPDTEGSVEQLTVRADDFVEAFVRGTSGLLFTIPVTDLEDATVIPPFEESAGAAEGGESE